VRGWLYLGQINDYVHGAASDSGFCGPVSCPKCGEVHMVTMSVIGWFFYECQSAMITGRVEDWQRQRGHLALVRKVADN
jgi:hypothetical protein